MYENVLMRVYACVCTGSWKLLPKYSHERYSQHGGPPNLGGKCRSNGNLVITFVEPVFWRAKRFYIPSIFKTARKTK